jgi:hypothetical protein
MNQLSGNRCCLGHLFRRGTTLPHAISPIDGALVWRLARRGVHKAIALPSSEIAAPKNPAAAAPTRQAHEPLPPAVEHRRRAGKRDELFDDGLRAVPDCEAIKKPDAIRLSNDVDRAGGFTPTRPLQ